MNLGRPIVTNGDFVAYRLSEPIELSFGGVSGVGPGIDVLDGGPRAQGEGAVSGIFWHLCPHSFEWAE